MGPDSVTKLEIWREGIELVKRVYCLTREWPKEETYGLTRQVRRAAVSIPANIAEGVGRGTAAAAAHFAQIALGSLYELDTLLHIAMELGISATEAATGLRASLVLLSRRLSAFIGYKQSKR